MHLPAARAAGSTGAAMRANGLFFAVSPLPLSAPAAPFCLWYGSCYGHDKPRVGGAPVGLREGMMVTALSWLPMATLLGVRHGLDADHLAAIDGLGRIHAATEPRRARRVGVWFALGHGLVVTVAALLARILTGRVPTAAAWALWISPMLLAVLGLFNALDLRGTPGPAVGRLVRVMDRCVHTLGASAIVATGALFAITFDTASQISVWALAGTVAHSWPFAVLLGLCFTLGMMLTDGLSGWWLVRALNRQGRPGLRRATGWGIALIAFIVAGAEVMQWQAPGIGRHQGAWDLMLTVLAVTPTLLLWRLRP